MALKMPSRKDRAAAVANGLFAPLAKRELLAGLGEVVNKKVPLVAIERNPNQPRNVVDEMGCGIRPVRALASIGCHDGIRVASDAGQITQKQAILIGQGVKEPELAAELAVAVRGLDERSSREVVHGARKMDEQIPAR